MRRHSRASCLGRVLKMEMVEKSERSTDEKDRIPWIVRTLDKGEAEFYLD